jgi:hypothetical protein
VSLRHPSGLQDRVVKLKRRKRTGIGAAVEGALVGMMTAFWLARLFWRGWRTAR